MSKSRHRNANLRRMSHAAGCRMAIFSGSRFAAQWPSDPERCDTCAERAAELTAPPKDSEAGS